VDSGGGDLFFILEVASFQYLLIVDVLTCSVQARGEPGGGVRSEEGFGTLSFDKAVEPQAMPRSEERSDVMFPKAIARAPHFAVGPPRRVQ